MTKECDIIHEAGDYWVCRDRVARQYVVMQNVGTHSTSDSAYALDEDGKSCAIYRCDYMAKRAKARIGKTYFQDTTI